MGVDVPASAKDPAASLRAFLRPAAAGESFTTKGTKNTKGRMKSRQTRRRRHHSRNLREPPVVNEVNAVNQVNKVKEVSHPGEFNRERRENRENGGGLQGVCKGDAGVLRRQIRQPPSTGCCAYAGAKPFRSLNVPSSQKPILPHLRLVLPPRAAYNSPYLEHARGTGTAMKGFVRAIFAAGMLVLSGMARVGVAVPGLPAAVSSTHDAVGNRLSRVSTLPGVVSESSSFDANDRLTGDTYDANGNTVAGLDAGRATLGCVYDFEDRIVAATTASGASVSIVYGGDGNRVAKTVDGVTTFHLVDNQNPTGYAQVFDEHLGVGAQTPVLCRVYAYTDSFELPKFEEEEE